LDLSKIESGKLDINYKAVNLETILNEIKHIFSQKIKEKGLDFIIAIEEDFPDFLLLDEIRLRQILFNLVGNAIKFTDKGYIKISVNKNYIEDSKKYLDLSFLVEDTGAGIKDGQKS